MSVSYHTIVLSPAVSSSMPEFHRMMEGRLRTAEQGADTVVWLALSRAAVRKRSGQFFQGKQDNVRTNDPTASLWICLEMYSCFSGCRS